MTLPLTLAASLWLSAMPSLPMLTTAIEVQPGETEAVDVPATEPVVATGEPEVLGETEEELLASSIEAQPIEASAVAFAELGNDELFDKAADALEGIGTLKARFEQVSPSGTFYQGDVALRRPGQLRFDYDDPSPQLIVATNGLVYVHDADLETTDSYPVNETPLKFLLTKRLDREAAELIDVIRGTDGVTLILASTDSETQGELALGFSAPDMELLGWGVREPGGSVTTVNLSEVETGIRLNNRLFRAPEAGGAFLRD